MVERLPQIKFYKDAVPQILAGEKTLEPRPRNDRWIARIENAKEIGLTWGPMIGQQHVFARAGVERVEVRPFETVSQEDLKKIGYGWALKPREEFIQEYNKWFKEALAKGYRVAWIYFKVLEAYEPF